jgi:hypothetical protein
MAMTARGAVLVLLGACSTSPGPGPATSHPSPAPAVSRDAAIAGDPTMIQLIHDLVALLSNEVTLDDITGRLGPVSHDPGVPMPAELAPRDPAMRRVEIGRYPDGGKPYTVELELASPVAVAALVAAFGAYRQSRTDRGMPREIVFTAAGTGPWHVVIVAQLPPGASPIAAGTTSAITLRRDPR